MDKRERNLAKLNAMLCKIDISASSIDKRLMKLSTERLAQCEAAEPENVSGCDACSTSTGSETPGAASVKTASSSDGSRVPPMSRKLQACYMQWAANGAAALGNPTRKALQPVGEKDGLRSARSPSPRASSPAMQRFTSDEQQASSAELGSTRTPSPGSSDVPDMSPYSPFEQSPSLGPPHEFDEGESLLVVNRLLQLLANPSKAKKRRKQVVFATEQPEVVAPTVPLSTCQQLSPLSTYQQLSTCQQSAYNSWQPAMAFVQAGQIGLHEGHTLGQDAGLSWEENWRAAIAFAQADPLGLHQRHTLAQVGALAWDARRVRGR